LAFLLQPPTSNLIPLSGCSTAALNNFPLQRTRATTCSEVTLLQQITLRNNGMPLKTEETPDLNFLDFGS